MHDIRQPKNHIVIIDGTLSRLDRGFETHCGKLYKLAMKTDGARRKVYYDRGIQGTGLNKWINVATGNGLNKSIIRSYRRLSESYRDGDKIFLFGYSRGAYAVRLLAGIIERMGLLKPEFATGQKAHQAFLHCANDLPTNDIDDFKIKYTRQPVVINFLGVWDTVKAIGLPIPFLRRYTPMSVSFRDYSLPRNVKLGCQALAFDEDRRVYRPELWQSCSPSSQLKQVLFAGTHSVVGGQSHEIKNAQYLSAYSLQWMLGEAQSVGLELPDKWTDQYPARLDVEFNPTEIRNKGIWVRERRVFHPADLFKKHDSLIAFDKIYRSIS